MKLNTKKTIAREFLILLSIFLISLFVFIIIYSFNSFRKYKITHLSEQIKNNKTTSDSLSLQFKSKREKQLLFHDSFYGFIYIFNHPLKKEKKREDQFSAAFDEANEAVAYAKSYKASYQKNENLLEFDTSLNYFKNDTGINFNLVKDFPAFSKEFGFSSPEKFKDYLNKYFINSTDTSNNNKAIKIHQSTDSLIRKQQDIKLAILSINKEYQIVLIVFLILSALLFPVRYIYYTVKWSINILRQKDK